MYTTRPTPRQAGAKGIVPTSTSSTNRYEVPSSTSARTARATTTTTTNNNQQLVPAESHQPSAATARAAGRAPLPPVYQRSSNKQQHVQQHSQNNITISGGGGGGGASAAAGQQQVSDRDLVQWHRIHHASIPPWEQERLLREVLMAMLVTDMSSPAAASSGAKPPSLHTRANSAATEIVSNFVRSAIVGTTDSTHELALASMLPQQSPALPASSGAATPGVGVGATTGTTANARPGSVSLGALRLPVNIAGVDQQQTSVGVSDNKRGVPGISLDGSRDTASGPSDDNNTNSITAMFSPNEQTWVTTARDRRQTQLERLLRDSQGEVEVLKQQLEDVTRAHDDCQRALNQAYHEYDSLQRHVLDLRAEKDELASSSRGGSAPHHHHPAAAAAAAPSAVGSRGGSSLSRSSKPPSRQNRSAIVQDQSGDVDEAADPK